uniref:Major facilitator superfamily (MFS) profile domain-containing protein n=1 Tax=Panagrolaimus davidi TaxID=227884 RepID=A0A914QXF5_9BILA
MNSRNSIVTTSSDEFYETSSKKKWYCLTTKRRWILAAILMLGNYCTISMRTHIGVAMVCMVNATAVYQTANPETPILPELTSAAQDIIKTPFERKCKKIELNELKSNDSGYHGTFVWSNEQQSLLFSAGFYGNLFTMFVSGLLISRFGPKMIGIIAMTGMSITMALSPILAYMNFYYFFIIRFLYGILENPMYPALSAILSQWFPATEKSTAAAIFTSGSQISASFGVLISTTLCSLEFMNGWPLIFYTIAGTGFVWVLIWIFFATNNPKNCKFLSNAEKEYLETKNGAHLPTHGTKKNTLSAIPYRKMIFSKATIAVVMASFAHKLTQTFMQIFLPSYARDVLVLDLNSNGIFTAVPFLCNLVSKYFLSICVDILKKKKIVSPTGSCIFFQCFASFGAAIVLGIMAFYIDCTKEFEAIILLALYGIFVGSAIPGFTTSQLSIAPMYAGMISSFAMVSGTLGNLLAPGIVGFFVDKGSQSEWGMVFGFIAFANVIGGTVFFFFGSAEIQSWAQPKTPPSSDASLHKTYLKYCNEKIDDNNIHNIKDNNDTCKNNNVNNKLEKY